MGWHNNWEVDFAGDIDWDQDEVENNMRHEDIEAQLVLLRGHVPELAGVWKRRVIVVVYTAPYIQGVLKELFELYQTNMRYREYGHGDAWEDFFRKAAEDEHEEGGED